MNFLPASQLCSHFTSRPFAVAALVHSRSSGAHATPVLEQLRLTEQICSQVGVSACAVEVRRTRARARSFTGSLGGSELFVNRSGAPSLPVNISRSFTGSSPGLGSTLRP